MQIPFCTVVRWWRNQTAAYVQAARLNYRWSEADRHDDGVTATKLRPLAGKWPDSADQLTRLTVLGLDPRDASRTGPQALPEVQRVRTLCANP